MSAPVVLDPTYFAPACTQLAIYGKDAVTISGAPEGQTLDNGCPLVSIVQGQTCGPNNTPYTVVTFDPPPPDGNINAGSCAPTGDASKFVCTSEETVSISAACYVETSGGGTCSAGYTFDPATNLCKYSSTGTSGACLAGATYDSSLKCCSAATGGNASSSYPLCPVGTYYDATLNACFDIPVSGAVSSSAVVALKNCTPGSNQPGCDPAVDPSCQGGPCPNGGTYTCVPNPNCPTRCPQICSCR